MVEKRSDLAALFGVLGALMLLLAADRYRGTMGTNLGPVSAGIGFVAPPAALRGESAMLPEIVVLEEDVEWNRVHTAHDFVR